MSEAIARFSSFRRPCEPRKTVLPWSPHCARGLIDAIVSDHDPQDVEVKRLPFAEAAPGAVGLETMLPVGLRLVHDESLSLLQLMQVMSSRPAELLGVPGGTLRDPVVQPT